MVVGGVAVRGGVAGLGSFGGWWRRVVETWGGGGWGRCVGETVGGDGWWKRGVVTFWWRRVVETCGGDVWG